MCGICGKVAFNGQMPDRDLIRSMYSTLLHRGPDDEGVYTAPDIGLGQRRLAIIDLSRSATAPLSNEDGTVWVVCNGEIYNFQTLRSELIERGHSFGSNVDTEVIVHLYEDYGKKCLAKLRGMFAFALWDAQKRMLFAARDRVGKKPFFYTKTSKAFIFGSEIKAITVDPEVPVSPNFSAIDHYLSYQYVPSPHTAFSGISKLPPGYYLTCLTDGKVRVQRYWSPPFAEKTTAGPKEIGEELIRLLRESVKLRMVADVPLGAFLSGGLDSTTVVAVMAEESSRPVKTFSVGFEDEEYNELRYAKLLADRYHTDHHEFVVKPNAIEVLPLLVRHYNEPFADSSALPTYYVSKITREYVTVALSGDGGDENFAGYDRYGKVLAWSRFDLVPRGISKTFCAGAQWLLDRFPYQNTRARISRGLSMISSQLRDRYILEMTMLKPQEKSVLYSKEFKGLLETTDELDNDAVKEYPWAPDLDPLDWMMHHDQSFYLPDCLMVKVDIASMANSLEVRSPLLDHKLIEFASTIPSYLKWDVSGNKKIFRNAVAHLLPAEILYKRKTGFSVPLAKWFRGELANLLYQTLLGEQARKRRLFKREIVRKMVEEHILGRRDWSNRLWTLLFLELWFKEFID